jgi:hypothetical protein
MKRIFEILLPIIRPFANRALMLSIMLNLGLYLWIGIVSLQRDRAYAARD